MNAEISRRLDAAREIARRAGQFLLEQERLGRHLGHEKKDNDYVTESDTLSEKMIISYLSELFPDDGFYGEETGNSSQGQPSRWVIDPIDGTVNFMRGIPNYTISIAWEIIPFEPLVGVVYNPRQDEMFWAGKGMGAWLNGISLHVSDIKEPRKALAVCVPPHRHADEIPAYFTTMEKLSRGVSDLRSFGSAALELAYIAAGRIDGYYEKFLGWYDIAAGTAILREAGGLVEPVEEEHPLTDDRCDLIASNGHIQDWLRATILS